MKDMREQRRRAAHRRRRIIFNNDGCDVWVNDGRGTPEDLLAQRTSGLLGSQVDAIFYCTVHSGFNHVSHNTAVGELFTAKDGARASNMTRDLIAQGTDALQVNVDFARTHGIEVFASMRMNDTHDGWGGDQGSFLLPQLKRDHPEWLLGSRENPPRFGMWSAVNYALAPIRDRALAMIRELVAQYDVDGIELDFLRHETYFPSTAAGEPCTDEEREQMTGLLRLARAAADQRAASRGTPALVAVRVEDSIDLNRDLGLDIERWLDEDLVDLVSASHYFRMVPWSEMGTFCAKHDVPFYPCLAEPRVRDVDGRTREPLRNSIESYRARAMNAYRAGASGVELYNLFDPKHPAFRELGDPRKLATRDKIYFASVRGSGGAHWRVPNAHRHRRIPVLSPEYVLHSPIPLSANPARVPLEMSDAPDAAASQRFTLRLRVAGASNASGLHVWFNGRELADGQLGDGFLDFSLDPGAVRCGENAVAVRLWPGTEDSPVLEDLQLHVTHDRKETR